jgi:hypothetical protein
MTENEYYFGSNVEEVIKTMFDREKSDAIFTSTLDDLDNLNTRDGKFEYSDYVTLHNDVTALYDSFSYVDEIIQLLASRATKAESENKDLRAELDTINAANVALHGALEQAEARLKEAVRDFYQYAQGGTEICAYCLHDNECEPGETMCGATFKAFRWRGMREGEDEVR